MKRHIHLECGRCNERLYTDLSEFEQEPSKSQPQLSAMIYTDVDPCSLAHLVEKEVNQRPRAAFNCSKNCHGGGNSGFVWLIDAGTGIVDRKSYKYAIACGEEYIRIVEAPKVVICLTLTALETVGGGIEASCGNLGGDTSCRVTLEDPTKQTFADLKTLIEEALNIPGHIPKYLLEDGTLLSQGRDSQKLCELFKKCLTTAAPQPGD